jgi:hypothetical protein
MMRILDYHAAAMDRENKHADALASIEQTLITRGLNVKEPSTPAANSSVHLSVPRNDLRNGVGGGVGCPPLSTNSLPCVPWPGCSARPTTNENAATQEKPLVT